jgi:hypothetical protein
MMTMFFVVSSSKRSFFFFFKPNKWRDHSAGNHILIECIAGQLDGHVVANDGGIGDDSSFGSAFGGNNQDLLLGDDLMFGHNGLDWLDGGAGDDLLATS